MKSVNMTSILSVFRVYTSAAIIYLTSLYLQRIVVDRRLPANRFPNKLASNVLNNILKNHPFCFFASFSIRLLC